MLEHELLLDEAHVAQLLGCERRTLQAWRCRGGGPVFVKVGRLVRYRPSAIDAWIEKRSAVNTGGASS